MALNRSTAKQQYSFGKAQRFQSGSPKQQLNRLNDLFYDLPSSFEPNKGQTTFGKGERTNFVRNRDQPGPIYQLPSEFLWQKQAESRFFGISSRDQANKNIVFKGKLPDPDIPGPGAYSLPSLQNGQKISIKGKLNEKLDRFSPGPGAYSPSIQKKPGEYYLSNFRNSGSTSMASKEMRFRSPDSPFPGPGQYPAKSSFLRSSLSSSALRSLSRREFQKSTRSEVPGPGQYYIPSEFGYNPVKYRRSNI